MAHMLLNMQTNGPFEPQTVCVELSQKHLETPAPEKGSTYQPLETYDFFRLEKERRRKGFLSCENFIN